MCTGGASGPGAPDTPIVTNTINASIAPCSPADAMSGLPAEL